MKIVLAGGSGLIGSHLALRLREQGCTVILLTRNPQLVSQAPYPYSKCILWDAVSAGAWESEFNAADAVINLTGESIAAKHWSKAQKNRIIFSRMLSTRAIVEALHRSDRKPHVLINASAVGFYGHVPEGDISEQSPGGSGFLAEVCRQWEQEALKAQQDQIRVVLLRTGIVLDAEAGVLPKLLFPYRLFLGGYPGSGEQWFPWIHQEDEIRAVQFLLEHSEIQGPVNLAAPDSVRMKEFCSVLASLLHRPSWTPIPAFFIRVVLGEMGQEVLLNGQNVVPHTLTVHGFTFSYPTLKDALKNLLSQRI